MQREETDWDRCFKKIQKSERIVYAMQTMFFALLLGILIGFVLQAFGIVGQDPEPVDQKTSVPVVSMIGTVQHRKTIGDLQEDESGYVVPWAFDPETNTLKASMSVWHEASGTYRMFVKRVVGGGYHVEIPEDYRW